MGFVGEVLSNENGIQWYYIIGMIIFIILFIVLIIKVVRIPKSDLLNYKESILENDNTADSN
jgi:uncharacterized integral membrane protein